MHKNFPYIIMKKIALTLSLLCLFLAQPVLTQNQIRQATIKGRIIDAQTNAPLSFATVVLSRATTVSALSQTTSDDNGNFTLTFPAAADSAIIMVQCMGYTPYQSPVFYKKQTTIEVGTLKIRPLAIDLEEVEVIGTKKQILYKIDKRVIDASGFGAASAGTAVDVLENTPSFRVDAEGQILFRGSSGFKVYIDGKPSIFSGTEGLEQIPANQIENIEVITTPSARYETDGDAGIINVITKKDYKSPLSGVVNLFGSSLWSRGGNLLLSQNKNKWEWHVGGNAQIMNRKSRFEQGKTTNVRDTFTVSQSDGIRKGNTYRYTGSFGTMYKMTDMTDFAIDIESGHAGNRREGNLNYSDTAFYDPAHTTFKDHKYLSRDNYDIHETYFQWNVQGNHKFDKEGHELSARTYAKYGGNAVETFESELEEQNNSIFDGHKAQESEYRWTVKGNADYALPFANKAGKFEGGFMYDFYTENGDYTLSFPKANDPRRHYSDFEFRQSIYSVYSQVTHEIGKFTYQVGLRGEQTRRQLISSEPGASNIAPRKFEFFPSAHVMYALPNEHILSAGYSRRTTRPALFFMEPYVTYVDYYTASKGNPYIQPEYINAVELGYRKNIGEHSISATAFHRARRDKIERVRISYMPGMTLDSMANVGNDYSTGLEATGTVEAFKWWSIVVNGSVFDYRIQNEFMRDGATSNSLNWQLGLNNSFNATRTTRFQLDANYVGPSVSTQGKTSAYFYMNASVRQQFFKRKLAATLALRNVARTARFKNHIYGTDGLESWTKVRPYMAPLVTLSLSYTFNDFKKKSTTDENGDMFEGSRH